MNEPSAVVDRTYPRSARLLGKRDFDFVFAAASRNADRYFTVLSRTQPDTDQARVGVVVSRKTARRAVDRNRIKRLIRETFRKNRSEYGTRDFVILPRPLVKQASNEQLVASLLRLWQQAVTKRT